MNNCLNCDKELEHIEGRRKKKYCDGTCRQQFWQKTHKQSKEKKYKLVPIREWNEFMEMKNGVTTYKAVDKNGIKLKGQVNFDVTPERMIGESGIDYQLRCAEWHEKRNKQ